VIETQPSKCWILAMRHPVRGVELELQRGRRRESVAVPRLWRHPGLPCLGDAAQAVNRLRLLKRLVAGKTQEEWCVSEHGPLRR
jgi:hypothetical protein